LVEVGERIVQLQLLDPRHAAQLIGAGHVRIGGDDGIERRDGFVEAALPEQGCRLRDGGLSGRLLLRQAGCRGGRRCGCRGRRRSGASVRQRRLGGDRILPLLLDRPVVGRDGQGLIVVRDRAVEIALGAVKIAA
jgi:hypothetical protein